MREAKLNKNQNTYLTLVRAHQPISTEDINERMREIGIGVKRKADLVDIREQLKARGLIYEGMNGWSCV